MCDKHSHVFLTWESVVGGGLGLWYVNHSEAPSLIRNQHLAALRCWCFRSVPFLGAALLNPDDKDQQTPNEQERSESGRIDKHQHQALSKAGGLGLVTQNWLI